MKTPAILMTALLAVALAACGGSGKSSSGGGGSATGGVAGTYNGIATVRLSSPAAPGSGENVTGTIVFVIDSSGRVTTDPGTPFQGSGRVNGRALSALVPGRAFNDTGLSCSGGIRFQGSINGPTISGTISSTNDFGCNGVPLSLTGTFRAERGDDQRALMSGSVMDEVGFGIRGVLGQ